MRYLTKKILYIKNNIKSILYAFTFIYKIEIKNTKV